MDLDTSQFESPIRDWLSRPVKATSVSDVSEIGAVVGSTLGEVRGENQDRGVIARFTHDRSGFIMLALCDGMGGLKNGGKCAEHALGALLQSCVSSPLGDPEQILKLAVNTANAAVFRAFRGEGGSTIAAILSSSSGMAATTVGDTRIYQYFAGSQKILQLSLDDTIAAELKRIRGSDVNGELLDAYSNRLAQFVGMGSDMDPRMYRIEERPNDLSFLLSSDGAYSMPPSIFDEIVRQAPSPFQAVSRVLQVSRWCGGKDNATIVLAPIASLVSSHLKPQHTTQRLEIWDGFGKLDIVVRGVEAGDKQQHLRAEEHPKPVPGSKGRRERQRRKEAARAPNAQQEQQPLESPRQHRRSDNGQRELKIELSDDDSGAAHAETASEPSAAAESKPRPIETVSDRPGSDEVRKRSPVLERNNT